MRVEHGDGWTLVCADWRDVEIPACDAVIEDPPYGRRTHEGQRAERATGYSDRQLTATGDLGYAHWEPDDVDEACRSAHERCTGWIVGMTSHDLLPHWEAALQALGRYVFAPIPIVIRGMNVRIAGDGPSNWTIHTVVSRLRTGKKCWGTKPGAYVEIPEDPRVARGVKGAKPLPIMLAVVRDYSERGDLVVDRFAGSGTTGIAAVTLGRRFFGCERDPEHFEIAVSRLRSGCARPDRGCGPLFDFDSATGGSDREDGDEGGLGRAAKAEEGSTPKASPRPQWAAHNACAEVGTSDDTAHPEASETSPDSLPPAAVLISDDGLAVSEAPSPARREPGFSESPAVVASTSGASSKVKRGRKVRGEGSPGEALPPDPADQQHGPANPYRGTDGVAEPCDDYTIPGDDWPEDDSGREWPEEEEKERRRMPAEQPFGPPQRDDEEIPF